MIIDHIDHVHVDGFSHVRCVSIEESCNIVVHIIDINMQFNICVNICRVDPL